MNTHRRALRLFPLLAVAVLVRALHGQGLDPNAIGLFTVPAESWPTYNGDYSGRRYSELRQVNQSNVDRLKIEWMYRIQGIGTQRGVGNPTIKSTPLLVDGILYFTIPDHIFAVNARTGERLWQYDFVDQGGHLIGQRGVGMYRDWLYFESPDGWFISLNSKDGKERWRKKIADEKQQYFTTMAPLIVRNHVLVGIGGDAMDVRGYLESRDPRQRRAPVALVHHAGEDGRSGFGDVAESGGDGPRRWHDLAPRHLRPRSESDLLGHG